MGGEKVKVVAGSKEGTIKVENHKDEYCQHIIRTLHILIEDLKYSEGFENYNINDEPFEYHYKRRLYGKAILYKDTFAIIGSDLPKTDRFDFSIRPVDLPPDEPDWRAAIGWLSSDWEIGNKEAWFCDVWISEDGFAKLMDSHLRGDLKSISIGLKTDAWANVYDTHSTPSGRVTWYLRPGRNGDVDLPDLAEGHVNYLRWGEPAEAPELPSNDLGQAFSASGAVPVSPSTPGLAILNKQLSRLFWGLIAIAFALLLNQFRR